MAKRSYYMTGVTASAVAKALGKLPDVVDDEVRAAIDEIADEGLKEARAKVGSSRVSVDKRMYASDGNEVRIVATGPVLKPADGSYSLPLAKLLEYGSGIKGDAAYGAEHRYKVNQGGKGADGWPFLNEKGEWRWTHGQGARHFMRDGAQKMRESVASVCAEHLNASRLKKEAGI